MVFANNTFQFSMQKIEKGVWIDLFVNEAYRWHYVLEDVNTW